MSEMHVFMSLYMRQRGALWLLYIPWMFSTPPLSEACVRLPSPRTQPLPASINSSHYPYQSPHATPATQPTGTTGVNSEVIYPPACLLPRLSLFCLSLSVLCVSIAPFILFLFESAASLWNESSVLQWIVVSSF